MFFFNCKNCYFLSLDINIINTQRQVQLINFSIKLYFYKRSGIKVKVFTVILYRNQVLFLGLNSKFF